MGRIIAQPGLVALYKAKTRNQVSETLGKTWGAEASPGNSRERGVWFEDKKLLPKRA